MTRHALPLVLLALLVSASAAHADNHIHVFLQGGQSNADGRANLAGLPANLKLPQDDVPFYYHYEGRAFTDGKPGTLTTLRPGASEFGSGSFFGPEVTFGRTAADAAAQAGTSVAIIKYANGGTTLATHWRAGGTATTANDGPEYTVFQSVVSAGLAALAAANPGKTIDIAGMTWVQGESDIDGGATTANAYAANLTNFIADVRQTYGANLPFFLSRLSDNQTVYSNPADPDYANYNVIRAAQDAAAATIPDVYLVDTDPDTFGMNSDNLHFNATGQQALGTAFAQSAIAAGAVPEPGAFTALVLAGAASVLTGRRRARLPL